MISVRMGMTVGEDPVQLITSHGAKYVAEYCLELNLQVKIGLPELMAILMGLYQQLENYNNTIRYQIIPKPLELVVDCKRYASVALGGTFDYLHAGHLLLLTYSRLLLRDDGQLIVGVTSESMLAKKKNREFLQSLYTRQHHVRQFLERLGTKKPRVFELTDPYGPTVTEHQVQAMVVTKETQAAGPKINEMREAKHFAPLSLYVMDLISDPSESSSKLSSTLIRDRLKQKNKFDNEMREHYRRTWLQTCLKLLAAGGYRLPLTPGLQDVIIAEGEYLFERYSEPWRYYHTNFHIFTLLEEYRADPAYRQKELSEPEEAALLLSVFYHDIVYQPDRVDNEQQSAVLLERFVANLQNISNTPVNEVSRLGYQLILMTKAHKPSCYLESLLNDLDMSVLAAPQHIYEVYSQQIKQEYLGEFASEGQFNAKRAKFLEGLNPSTVFYLHPERELHCSRNIQAERNSLLSQLSK